MRNRCSSWSFRAQPGIITRPASMAKGTGRDLLKAPWTAKIEGQPTADLFGTGKRWYRIVKGDNVLAAEGGTAPVISPCRAIRRCLTKVRSEKDLRHEDAPSSTGQ